MSNLSAAEYRVFSRTDLHSFMHRAFLELNPRVPFMHNWHNELIAAKLEGCFRGGIRSVDYQPAARVAKIPRGRSCFLAYVC